MQHMEPAPGLHKRFVQMGNQMGYSQAVLTWADNLTIHHNTIFRIALNWAVFRCAFYKPSPASKP